MYYCQDCEKEFRSKKIITETHGFSEGPYEYFGVCPHCEGSNIKRIPPRFCSCCGARMSGKGEYCSAACKKRGEYLFAKEKSMKERWEKHPLNIAIKEVEQYNKEHGTNLSYGQYFAGVR